MTERGRSEAERISTTRGFSFSMPRVAIWMTRTSSYMSAMSPGRPSPSALTSRRALVEAGSNSPARSFRARSRLPRTAASGGSAPKAIMRPVIELFRLK